MQKIFIAAFTVALFSCHADEKKESDNKPTAATNSTLPYTATYSSKFEIGDAKNAEAVLAAWKSWDDGDLQTSRKLFADTMHFYLRNGSEMHGTKDSTLAGGQQFRNNYTSIKSTVHVYMPLKSVDKNENWVCIWGTEVMTDKQGKVDSVELQESWRFNKEGKIDLLYQFGRSLVPPPMPK
jgi:predicted lipid-binding transport protein (Tim44 family)